MKCIKCNKRINEKYACQYIIEEGQVNLCVKCWKELELIIRNFLGLEEFDEGE